jgi:hypothetical protein
MLTLLEVMGILLGLYWMGLGLQHYLRDSELWNSVFDFDEPRLSKWESQPWPLEKEAHVEEESWLKGTGGTAITPKPLIRERRNMGPHPNWLSLEGPEKQCHAEFERMDARTWQCTVCHSLHFEKIQGEAS